MPDAPAIVYTPAVPIVPAPGPVFAPMMSPPYYPGLLPAPPPGTAVIVSEDFAQPPIDHWTRGLQLFADLDSWHGVGDRGHYWGGPTSNDGGSFGFNYASRLGGISDATGIQFQIGGSYGVYDWNGRPLYWPTLDPYSAQQQTFVTLGFFKRVDEHSNWSYGFVHDWMFNQAFGAYAVNPTLGQWRGQLAFASSPWNEWGVWATLRDKGAANLDWTGTAVHTRAVNQANFFWHHKWRPGGADSWLWIGVPDAARLSPYAGGSLGNLLLGGSIVAPISQSWSLYSNMQYMHPSAGVGPLAANESSWYLAFGLQFTFGGAARSATVAGKNWLPLMPVANNGNFLVDSARF